MIALLMGGRSKRYYRPRTAADILSIIGAVADLRLAIALIAIPIVATNIYQAFYGGRALEMLLRYWVINLVGRRNGHWCTDPVHGRSDILTTTLGVVVIVYVAINATGFTIRVFQMLPRGRPPPWA